MGWREKLQDPEASGYSLHAKHWFLDREETSQDLSAADLNFTTTISAKFRVLQVLLHASTELNDTTITVTFNSVTGANYDTAIGAEDFDGTADIGLIAGDNLLGVVGQAGDEITIVSSGTDTAGVLYVTVIFELLK